MNISILQKSCVKALCKQFNHTSITQMTRLLKKTLFLSLPQRVLLMLLYLIYDKHIFSAIQVMKILTLVLTKSLGNYHWSYLNEMDDEGRAFVQKLVLYFKYTCSYEKCTYFKTVYVFTVPFFVMYLTLLNKCKTLIFSMY